jgi:concentrative nucleoside transporter, CNT family
MDHLISFFGIFVMLGLAYALSYDRRAVDFRTVAAGLGLQFGLALLVLWSAPGKALFSGANAFVLGIIRYSNAGAQMVFGEGYAEHFFAFAVLPSIIFFSSLMALLFHLGVMQRVVGAFSWLMQRTMRVSGAEATAASARVFVGGIEAAFTIKPYVSGMTRSEIMALSTAGMATIAGGVLAAFAGFGIDAGHLLAAQILSAVGALVIAKILLPEKGKPATRESAKVMVRETRHVNVFDAACSGAVDGIRVAATVAAVLIAFVALTSMANSLLGFLPAVAGGPLSVERVLGWVFRPIVFLTGAPWADCGTLGALLGKKMFLNEFLAFLDLKAAMATLSPRSVMLATYFLCGFANFSALAMQIGGMGSLFPAQREAIAEFGLTSMLGGTLASLLSACIAGTLL